jgi:uncharacterized protein (DUF433 family)
VAPARSPSERRSTCHGKIEARPDVLGGKPVIAGTRISVELVLEKLGAGWAGADLLDAYPALVEADILAALRYAADVFRTEVIFPLPPTPPGPAAPPPGPGAEAAG